MASTFTDNDVRLLDKTISLRERLIDSLVTNRDLPTRDKDVLALTNLLESVDRSIFSKAKIHIEDVNAKNNEATKEVLKELLLNLHMGSTVVTTTTQRETPIFKTTNIPVSDGELISKCDNFNPMANAL